MFVRLTVKVALLVLFAAIVANLSTVRAQENALRQTGVGSEEAFVKHLNSGVSLANGGKTGEAIVELKKAAAIKPDDPLLLVNLGQAYQLSGKNVEALDQYKKYLRLYPKGPYVAQITSMFRVMQTQIQQTGGKSSQGKDNYLTEAVAPGGGRWDQGQMPLRVFVASGAGVEDYKDEFAGIFKKAFADWCEATQGKVSVSYVESPQNANIVCKWTANVKDLANPAEGGQAFVQMVLQRSIIKADLLLLTHDVRVPATVTPESYMRFICLHEIGHALGLAGHSSQPGDIMFSLMNYEAATKELTDRDKKTILALYGAPATAGHSAGVVPVILQVTPGAGAVKQSSH